MSTVSTRSPADTWKRVGVFLGLAVALSLVPYWQIASAGKLQASGGLYVALLMLSPGLAAILTKLVFNRSLRGLGWRPGRKRYLLLGFLLPLGYGLAAYAPVWATGLGRTAWLKRRPSWA